MLTVPELEVRPVLRSDLDNVSRLEESCFDDPYPPYFLSQLADANPDTFLVAVSSNNIVGYAVMDHWDGSEHLVSIAVEAAWRRRGVAQQLLTGLLARIRTGRTMGLEVRRGNSPAILLYLKNGFKEVGLQPGYYRDGEDALLMEKRL